MRLVVPKDLQPLIREIAAFFAARDVAAYAAGGFVRDVALGWAPHDVDLAVSGNTLALGRALAEGLGGSFVALDEGRGHVRIVLPERDVFVDLTPYGGDIEADLRRRDFTIDAMAAPLSVLANGEADVIDPLGGKADLASKLVRALGEEQFEADPLRALRGARIAAQVEFEIEPSTRDLVAKYAARVVEAAPERQREELMRVFAVERAGRGVRLMDELGLLSAVLPEMDVARGVEQPKEHFHDVFGHSVAAVEALDIILSESEPESETESRLWRELWSQLAWWDGARDHFRERLAAGTTRRTLLKFCGLLHDIGKPATKSFEASGRMRFFGHSDVGAEMAVRLMRRLRFSSRETDIIRRALAEHLRPVQMAQERAPTRRAVYRYFRAAGDAGIDTLFLSLADHLGTVGPDVRWEGWRAHVAMVSHVLRLCFENPQIIRPPKLIDGDDLMREFGLEPGPLLGELLEAVREAHAAGEVATAEQALALARKRLR
ncbi:MAG TPA: HD domain-containing protein [Dehalococcoidia bacterium]|nr:HD domain-containing protein [Dehalococcoidia bacterium]